MAKSPENKNLSSASEIILYQAEDGRNRIEVRLEHEAVWLTRQFMAELFQTTVSNISMRIRNIYADGELSHNLMADFEKHRNRKSCQYATISDEYYPKHSKPIIDEIDKVLAKHYSFTDPPSPRLWRASEELDFIINYDIKYRMGLSADQAGGAEEEG